VHEFIRFCTRHKRRHDAVFLHQDRRDGSLLSDRRSAAVVTADTPAISDKQVASLHIHVMVRGSPYADLLRNGSGNHEKCRSTHGFQPPPGRRP